MTSFIIQFTLNIYINNPTSDYQGLFGYSRPNVEARIQNITISSGYIYGNKYVGGIVGQSVFDNYLCVVDCVNKAEVIGTDRVGGIVGEGGGYSSVVRCKNEGNITATSGSAGGIYGIEYIVRSSDREPMVDCENTGVISGTTTGELAGGTIRMTGGAGN